MPPFDLNSRFANDPSLVVWHSGQAMDEWREVEYYDVPARYKRNSHIVKEAARVRHAKRPQLDSVHCPQNAVAYFQSRCQNNPNYCLDFLWKHRKNVSLSEILELKLLDILAMILFLL